MHTILLWPIICLEIAWVHLLLPPPKPLRQRPYPSSFIHHAIVIVVVVFVVVSTTPAPAPPPPSHACVGKLILLAQMHTNHTESWLEGKIIIIFFSFNYTVLSCNILAYCCMRRHREWGAMAAVGCRRPPWVVRAWFTCFYLPYRPGDKKHRGIRNRH